MWAYTLTASVHMTVRLWVCAESTIALLNMQLWCIEFLAVRKQMESQSTCLIGTSKDSQYKCKITSHLDSWMPNTWNLWNCTDHVTVRIHPAKAVETKQILFFSKRKVYIYSLIAGAHTSSAGGGHSSPMWHHGLEWKKSGKFTPSAAWWFQIDYCVV